MRREEPEKWLLLTQVDKAEALSSIYLARFLELGIEGISWFGPPLL